ncbi:MAG: hypothetical protein JW983_03940 [Elusimicrobia bacterium]|nr:hypothetical protein [Elusimicrobiota bacterium]
MKNRIIGISRGVFLISDNFINIKNIMKITVSKINTDTGSFNPLKNGESIRIENNE